MNSILHIVQTGAERAYPSGDNEITLFCDREWMIEAVSNLVKNAFDHTEAGKRICVEWKQMSDMLQIVVEDNGCGIHSEDIYHIFKRFYRSRFSKDTQGIGLGLPLAKTIVELHGGNIKVDSVLGKGSTFFINILKINKICKKFVCFGGEHYRIVGLEKYQSKDWVLYFFAEGGITPMNLSDQKSNRRHSMNLLEVNGISKTYGAGETAVHALKNVSFSVPKGEFVAVVGESGSGKSTLLNMLGALDVPTSGKVMIDGKDTFSMRERQLTVFRRRNIGFIFQAFNLVPELTVEQNIIFPALLDYQKPNKKYLEDLLNILNLKERRNHLPSQLSGGQQQRVAIGRALFTRPALILADEPTGNLDSQNTSEVIALLKEASKKYEQTIIMITHSRSIAQTADRILQVSDGELTDLGRCRE